MADAVQPHPLRFGFVGPDQPDALQQQRAIADEAWRIELVDAAQPSWSRTRCCAWARPRSRGTATACR